MPCWIFSGKTGMQTKDADEEIGENSAGYGVCSVARWKDKIGEAVTGKAWAMERG
jgi:hypothetical protein